MPYFDHNATTPLSPAAREAWLRASDEAWQNPSSPYRSAARVRNLLEDCRGRVADLLGCEPSQVVFNSGGTEGVNAIFQYCATRVRSAELPAVLSPVEHSCVQEAAKRYFNGRLLHLPIPADGKINPTQVETCLKENKAALVSVMAANNETGALQPWQEIADLCRRAGVPFHCDAAQWTGKMPLADLGKSGFVTAAAHKFGGPKGCGFLVLPQAADDFRNQVGGQQESGHRAGTEDYPAIAAMTAALEAADRFASDERERAKRLEWRGQFERLVGRLIPGSVVVGERAERLWNTVSLVLPVGANDRWVRKLDRAGFQVSTGSACSTGKDAPSHVLAALGFSAEEAKRAIRISSGWQTALEEWEGLAAAMKAVFEEFRKEDRPDGDGLTEVIRV